MGDEPIESIAGRMKSAWDDIEEAEVLRSMLFSLSELSLGLVESSDETIDSGARVFVCHPTSDRVADGIGLRLCRPARQELRCA